MEYKELKELIKGARIPALGVGTLGMGGKDTADYSNDVESIIAIRTARAH
jgi:aryl-alcohol dehydrogenase-like predicted oxidoreductase